ncbi:methyltransferase [Roseateles sp. DAIF2]|uniref:class I SAM-dependent methyltransferase n=1 Tax=Roseateles sp. DAIF2 TaxID=2714952 RepID=UPI0018A31272|nr:class I SAM-dependent methyltransferase [Roseateles sp. DAIF2]QPF71475.1 methyltransferase [Roseateles sp. DAIF2]
MQALLDTIASMDINSTISAADAHRLFHGRGGLHPGCEQWTLDFYPPVFLLTSFQPATEEELARIGAALAARWQDLAPAAQPLNWVYQCRQEGGRSETRLMGGAVPEPHHVTENGTRYLVHLLRGQNHGLFLDMAEGRRWLREQVGAAGGGKAVKVLNLFAYTCGFSVVALQAGAAQVVNVDMSSGALAIGQQNHRLNGIAGGASFLAHDVFNSWGKIKRLGAYELVVLDPPGHQKGSFVATKDYARLMRRLPDLLAPGGRALLCLSTPKLDMAFLQDQMRELAPGLVFERRLPNPPAFADVSDERALKVLVYANPAG